MSLRNVELKYDRRKGPKAFFLKLRPFKPEFDGKQDGFSLVRICAVLNSQSICREANLSRFSFHDKQRMRAQWHPRNCTTFSIVVDFCEKTPVKGLDHEDSQDKDRLLPSISASRCLQIDRLICPAVSYPARCGVSKLHYLFRCVLCNTFHIRFKPRHQ